jgi:hypothetical protein
MNSREDEHKISSEEMETGKQFMLAELDNIRAFKEQSVTIGDKRVDVFLTLASALVAGLGLLSQTGINARSFLFVALGGALSLLAMGINVFRQVLERDILLVDYIRYMNRIRCYFAERAPHLKPFLLMPTSHNFPKYDWQSSNRRTPMVINAVASGIAVALISMLVKNTPNKRLQPTRFARLRSLRAAEPCRWAA